MLLAIALATGLAANVAYAQIIVHDGVADLRQWNPKSGEILELRGDWEFVPGALVSSPMGTPVPEAAGPPRLTRLPNRWNEIDVQGKPFGSFGAATYRLKLLLPARPADAAPLALAIREVYTTGRIYVNGQEIAASGRPALDAASELARAKLLSARLPPGVEAEIAVQVSNFLHFEGGISFMPRLGLEADLDHEEHQEVWTYLLVIGALGGLTLFFLAAYLAGRRDYGALLFGLTCILAIVRIFSARRLIYDLYPDVPHRLVVAIEYVDLYLLVTSSLLLWQWLFPKETYARVIQFTCVLSLFVIGAALVFPVYWLTYFRDILTLYAAVGSFYGFGVALVAWWRGRLGSTPMVIAMAVAFVLFMHDILANLKVIVGTDVGAFAFIVFALGNAVVMGQRAEAALAREENLSRETARLNQSLEMQVRERTQHLEREIERRAEAEQESARASAAKSEFLATMSHEIRTPLNGVIGIAQILYEDVKDPALRSRVNALVNTGELLLSIVSDILDFSKIEAGQFEINPKSAAIGVAIRDVGSLFKSQAILKGLRFTVSIDPDLPTHALIDSNRLRQIIANIVANAVKFTDEGEVTIVAKAIDDRLIVEVGDTGVGIASDMLPDLFKPFMQIRSSLADGQRGTGLGLSIASRLTQLMGGRISVTSELGRGSVFRVDLPLMQTIDAEVPASEPALHSPSRKLRVLVADDGEVNRMILGEFVRREGHEVLFAQDGIEAITIASREQLDLIFIDIAMPKIDGFEATKAIRKLAQPACRVRIIAATATTQETFRMQCLDAGMDDFIPKPIRRPDVARILAQIAQPQINVDTI